MKEERFKNIIREHLNPGPKQGFGQGVRVYTVAKNYALGLYETWTTKVPFK